MILPKRSRIEFSVQKIKKNAAFGAIASILTISSIASVLVTASNAPSCPLGSSLNIVAHADDDLIFMNPDIQRDIDNGLCVQTVVVTAGDAGQGLGYAEGREAGSRAAYASMAGLPNNWTVDDYIINGHRLWHFALNGRPTISLVYMRINDGNVDGSGFPATGGASLKKLWNNSISSVTSIDTIPEYKQTYTEQNLVTTLAQIIMRESPEMIRGMDAFENLQNTSGDHADHMALGYLVQQAERESSNIDHFASYRGYGTSGSTVNISGATLDRKWNAFLTYAVHDQLLCHTREDCSANNGAYGLWMSRQYDRGRRNVAPLATVTASTQNTAGGQGAVKAVDGVALGYPVDSSKEWSTTGGGAGSWINLSWKSLQTIDKVILYDRPNSDDQVFGGVLSFSDGSSIAIGDLYNTGSATVISFSPKNITSLRFTINAVSGTTHNVGLAELEAVTTNIAGEATVQASSQNTSGGQGAVKAVDGIALGYPKDSAKEWATAGGKAGSWIQLNWVIARNVNSVVLFDRPNTSDRVTGGQLIFSDGTIVPVGALPNDGSPLVVPLGRSILTQSVRFKVNSVSASTSNVGLAEIQAHDGAYVTNGL